MLGHPLTGYYLARGNELQIYAIIWMTLKSIMLSDKSQSQ